MATFIMLTACHATTEQLPVENNLVPSHVRTSNYKAKSAGNQTKQPQAAKVFGLSSPPRNRQEAKDMRQQLQLIRTTDNYIINLLTHSIPYTVS